MYSRYIYNIVIYRLLSTFVSLFLLTGKMPLLKCELRKLFISLSLSLSPLDLNPISLYLSLRSAGSYLGNFILEIWNGWNIGRYKEGLSMGEKAVGRDNCGK